VAGITGERQPGRPPFLPSDLNITAESAGQTASLRIDDVPPYFFETVLSVPVVVESEALELRMRARVRIRGNVVISTGRDGRVLGVASDGRPATGGGGYPEGELVTALDDPRAILLLSDGTLLVHDHGADPKRLERVRLVEGAPLLPPFQYRDGDSNPLFRPSSVAFFGMTQLPDGRVVVPEYQFAGVSSDPKSRLMVWDAAGTFLRSVWAPSPMEDWRSVARGAWGDVLVADVELEQVTSVDAMTLQARGAWLDSVPADLAGLHGGDEVLVGGDGFVLEVQADGTRQEVRGLPGDIPVWRAFTRYEGGRVLAANGAASATLNLALVGDGRFIRDFRTDMNGPFVTIWGLAYLR
jgi:hypothetical protein